MVAATNLQKLIVSFMKQVQLFEDAALAVVDGWLLDNAQAFSTIEHGERCGEPSNGEINDYDIDAFKARIRRRIKANNSRGTINNLLEYVAAIGNYAVLNATDFKDSVLVWTDSDYYYGFDSAFVADLQRIAAAGVKVNFGTTAGATVFCFADDAGNMPAFSAGFADDGGYAGGNFLIQIE